MKQTPNNFIAGVGGTYIASGTSLVSKSFSGFQVNSAAVVTEIYHNGSDTNVLSTYGLSGITLAAGTLITAQGDNTFSGIKLSSGDVNLILL